MSNAVFYHAGCQVCVAAEQQLLDVLDTRKVDVEVVHLGDEPARLADAERAGLESVPALVLDGAVFHINFGAALSALK